MKSKFVFLLALGLTASSLLPGQTAQRWAVVSARGPLARGNQGIANLEDRVTDELTSKLTGLPGVALVDRASIDKVLKEQNFQNSDRSSADTAVRIGKLMGVGQIVLLQVTDFSYTTHNDQSGNTTKTIGTIILGANARVIDVETGVIRAQPQSSFQDSVTVSETTKTTGFNLGTIHTPPKQKTTGGDPKVIAENEVSKSIAAVVTDISGKLTGVVSTVSASAKPDTALVAGIANGAVVINRGSSSGIKAGDKLQIVRKVSLGLNDPETGKPMMQKQRVCVLTIVTADEGMATGNCQGGVPQTNDVAEPVKQ